MRNPTQRTNSRPCDACAIRRVRCDLQNSPSGCCTNCRNHDIQCTNVRVRQKSGPKKIKQKTRDSIVSLVSNTPRIKTYSLDDLLPFLQLYQTWYYCIWPVLSVSHLTSVLSSQENLKTMEPLQLFSPEITEAYALSCAVCAAVSGLKKFVKSTAAIADIEKYPSCHEYAREANRIINEFELRGSGSMNVMLANFFLHVYYSNITDVQKGISYLREAIAIAHILKLHEADTYTKTAEGHRHKKIYYSLLITERFVSFETAIPILLEPTIPIPDLQNEEYSDLLLGFIELADVFCATDKMFFSELHTSNTTIQDLFPSSNKRQWILKIQKKLDHGLPSSITIDSQKVNITLSKSWVQALTWLLTNKSSLLSETAGEQYFQPNFPLTIAHEFLESTAGLPEFAFESNGRGVSTKLLEVAESLCQFNSIAITTSEQTLALDQLNSIFRMIMKFRNGIPIPAEIYSKITTLLHSRGLSYIRPGSSSGESTSSFEFLEDDIPTSRIEEIDDTGKSISPFLDDLKSPVQFSYSPWQMGHSLSVTSLSGLVNLNNNNYPNTSSLFGFSGSQLSLNEL